MADSRDEFVKFRRQYHEDLNKVVAPHHLRSFEYETKAIEFANGVFRALTDLNGGALVALQSVMAIVKLDSSPKLFVLASFFIGGLTLVILAQVCGFFTMARR